MRRTLTTILAAGALATAGVALAPSQADAIPIRAMQLESNTERLIRVTGWALSPRSANCVAVFRSTLQVRSPGGWRTVKRIGSHRLPVCKRYRGRWAGDFRANYRWNYSLRGGQKARVCVSATQTVNGRASKHVACKQFTLFRTRGTGRTGSNSPGL